MISKRYPVQPSGHRSRYFSQEIVPVARRVRRGFCRPCANFIKSYIFIISYKSVMGARINRKNHDKLINYTVRVMFRPCLLS